MNNPKHTILQSVLIFLSVFLGIWAGNWNASRKEHQRTRHFLENLNQELQVNRKNIERSIPYHEFLHNYCDSIMRVQDEAYMTQSLLKAGGFNLIEGWRGMGVTTLESAVYQSGVMGNNLEHIPIDLLVWISKTYTYQDEYRRFSRSISEKMLNLTSETKVIDLMIIIEILGGDILGMEKQMIDGYDRMIESIEKELAKG